MLDQSLQSTSDAIRTLDGKIFDLVVVGAGIAGLNALYAASDYLSTDAKVLLLDQKAAPGGMWNTAYDYVRLHQPHPMFTVGDLKWGWRKPRSYLAARDEVQSHLAHALDVIGTKVALRSAFGQSVKSCTEVETPQGPMAEIVFQSSGDGSSAQTVHAKRCIHASGLNYAVATPLAFANTSHVSIIPQDLRETLDAHPSAPVVVVGGGKTGMDTVLATLADNPARHITLIQGRGTNFLNRTKYVPTGLRRWTSGALVSGIFRDVASAFDGDNEDATLAYIRKHYSTDPTSNNGVFLYGLQSEEELAKIKAGVAEIISDYLDDVVETPDGPQMKMQSGAQIPVAQDTIFVNCTGSFFRQATLSDPMPILSEKDCILSINARDSFHFLTSVTGFFATHLWFRDRLRGTGFYTLDLEELFRKNRNAWVGASAAQAYLNQVIAVQTLPMMLLDRCGLDLDRWYPLPRRMAGLMRMKASAARDIAQCRKSLDRVADRFDVHSAPLG